jgi:Na+-transporting methylmalonyl-CoA/oxaloacetate decarboxylase gamma subunit
MEDLLFGLRTTVLGMGIVFGVLAILWGLLTLVVRLDARSARAAAAEAAASAAADAGAPDPGTSATGTGAVVDGGPAEPAPPIVRLVGAPDDLDPRLVAAITVAILRHAEARRLQAAPAMRSYWPGSLLFASRWVAAGRTRQGQSWRRRR